MDIKAQVRRRLRQQLADEKALFEARQAAALVEAEVAAAKAERDAVEVAHVEALAEQRRVDAEWAERLEGFAANGFGSDLGTPEERREAMRATGITPYAIGRAAADGTSAQALDSDDLSWSDESGRHFAGESYCGAVAGLIFMYRRTLNSEAQAALAQRDAERREALNALADARIAEYAEQLRTTQAMES